jgi:hypothetical protein
MDREKLRDLIFLGVGLGAFVMLLCVVFYSMSYMSKQFSYEVYNGRVVYCRDAFSDEIWNATLSTDYDDYSNWNEVKFKAEERNRIKFVDTEGNQRECIGFWKIEEVN